MLLIGSLKEAYVGRGKGVKHYFAETSPACAPHREKSRNIHECNDRKVKRIAEANEAGSFDGRVNVKAPCKFLWIVAMYGSNHDQNNICHESGKE